MSTRSLIKSSKSSRRSSGAKRFGFFLPHSPVFSILREWGKKTAFFYFNCLNRVCCRQPTSSTCRNSNIPTPNTSKKETATLGARKPSVGNLCVCFPLYADRRTNPRLRSRQPVRDRPSRLHLPLLHYSRASLFLFFLSARVGMSLREDRHWFRVCTFWKTDLQPVTGGRERKSSATSSLKK